MQSVKVEKVVDGVRVTVWSGSGSEARKRAKDCDSVKKIDVRNRATQWLRLLNSDGRMV